MIKNVQNNDPNKSHNTCHKAQILKFRKKNNFHLPKSFTVRGAQNVLNANLHYGNGKNKLQCYIKENMQKLKQGNYY